eukprot:Opistho-2@35993
MSQKEGYLSKQGAVGGALSWRKRWFVLKDGKLYYYKSNKHIEGELGVIDLSDCSKVEACGGTGLLIHTPNRIFKMEADAETSRNAWLTTLLPLVGPPAMPVAAFDGSAADEDEDGDVPLSESRQETELLNPDRPSARRVSMSSSSECSSGDTTEDELSGLDLSVSGRAMLASMSSTGASSTSSHGGHNHAHVHLQHLSEDVAKQQKDAEEAPATVTSTLAEIDGVSSLLIRRNSSDKITFDAAERAPIALTTAGAASAPAEEKKILLSGSLYKLGAFHKAWRRRWFVLEPTRIVYYKKDKDDRPLGIIELASCYGVERMDDTSGRSFCFKLSSQRRVFVMSTNNASELNVWLSALCVLVVAVEDAHGSDEEQLGQGKTIAPSSSTQETNTKSGWLTKQGGIHRSWRHRYFVLRGTKVSYYKTDETNALPLGTIDLAECTGITRLSPDRSKKPNGFEVATSRRRYALSAASTMERDEWVAALEEAIPEDDHDLTSGAGKTPADRLAAQVELARKSSLLLERQIEELRERVRETESKIEERISVIGSTVLSSFADRFIGRAFSSAFSSLQIVNAVSEQTLVEIGAVRTILPAVSCVDSLCARIIAVAVKEAVPIALATQRQAIAHEAALRAKRKPSLACFTGDETLYDSLRNSQWIDDVAAHIVSDAISKTVAYERISVEVLSSIRAN